MKPGPFKELPNETLPTDLARGIVTIHRGGQTDPSRALASGVNRPPLLHSWRFPTERRL